MAKLKAEEQEELKRIDALLEQRLDEAFAKHVSTLVSRIAELEEINKVQLQARRDAELAERKAKEYAAKEAAEAEVREKQRRERLAKMSGESARPRLKVACEICGNEVVDIAAFHVIDGNMLCVRNAKRAKQAGRINRVQYDQIVTHNEGNEQGGMVVIDANTALQENPWEHSVSDEDQHLHNPVKNPSIDALATRR